ncbi:bifunctional riboflavin kinase/FAD synthetase [Anaerococcus sp. NML200574]|uniref:bifunctional riboflavin kinase/FAD synthetase n=1 Tax=unclassified Anaerococcus TaxID=2614126 RepID=UPI0022377F7B|nr:MULTISPECIES: bifunctional riboflavin kinase/FAD synthetase [unclassified Anaerococcus]MCW6678731.1 bifunctional riboflavin kinase/FAD synthetase [Anaerococcus sp. NML200574]MCW6702095.1 bifunctional riboflavin kinase/FAD synthetase [Anaerococcus sp. NML200537]
MKDKIRIYDLNSDLPDLEKKAVALGYFDGVHLGHQKLMEKNIYLSKKYGLTPSVLLFKEDGKRTVKDEDKYLSSLEDKIEILSEIGIKTFCLVNFDKTFMELSPREFIKTVIAEKLNAKVVIVGSDYRFGYKAKGTIDTLREYENIYSYKAEIIDFELEDDNSKISSKHIRELVKEGEISKANKYLGRYYKIRGEVVHGKHRGRTLNFPTANLELNFPYVIPKDGVYLTRILVRDKYYYALTNIGSNPTFETSQDKKIESYIYDFNQHIYGENISVEFIEFFRPDFKFNSAEELIEQMDKDKAQGLEYIEKHLK